MFAWDNEDVCSVAPALCPAWPCPRRLTPTDPRNYSIAESLNRQGAHFDRIANREALCAIRRDSDNPAAGYMHVFVCVCISI